MNSDETMSRAEFLFEKHWATYDMNSLYSDTEKANMRHGFILGFADGVMEMLRKITMEAK